MISIFTDKSTIILRKMLKDPTKAWVIHDFTGARDKAFGVGQGRVQKVLNEMERLGYVERARRGPRSKTVLTNPEKLVADWLKAYSFDHNEVRSYYSPDKGILRKMKEYLGRNEIRYALTLHTGANIHTSFVRAGDVHFYIDAGDIERDTLDMRQRLDLKELVKGGNIHIARPYYRHSVFFGLQRLKGQFLVSNLQLYLDLYHFQPRGREHAEYLQKVLAEKDKRLA